MLGRLVFSVTHACPISCKYCVTNSGPGRLPFLDADFMIVVIDEVLALSAVQLIVFTGGEALLFRREVERAIRHAKSHNIWTRIVSNAVWATSRKQADKVLHGLKKSGLCELNLSCDDFHQEHIPLDRVKNAFWAARALEIPVLLAHKHIRNEKVTIDYLSEFLGIDLQFYVPGEPRDPASGLISSGCTVPVGTGVGVLNEDDYIIYPDARIGSSCDPCASGSNLTFGARV
jgi:organic radical activating enzyme